jgi:Cof subfamily protein (haloacid dehalogenase superfamily)
LKLYISDLDGTLLNSKRIISKNSAAIINDLIASGMKFTVATARSYEACHDVLRPLNLNLPMILNNGVFVYDPVSGENIVENYLDRSSVKFILDYYESRHVYPFVSSVDSKGNKKIFYKGVFNRGQEIYTNFRRASRDKRLTLVDNYSVPVDYNVINIFAIEEKGRLDKTYQLFKSNLDASCHYTEEIYSKGFFWLEVTNSRGNKSWAAEFLKKYLKIDKMICFGDNLNDESLFRIADEKYAVKNAYKQLKDLATDIIDSNNDDGVARFLQFNTK